MAIQADGKIVAVGGARVATSRLARYNPNGSLDMSFSGDGLQTTDFLFGAGDAANDVAIQANGRIVAVGVAGGGATGNDFGLARYNSNGSLDTSFSGDGRKRTSFGGSDGANGVALQGDGRIVAVGRRQRRVRACPVSRRLRRSESAEEADPADADRAAGGCPGLPGGGAPATGRSRGSTGTSRRGRPRPDLLRDGKQRTDFGAGPSGAAAVVRQADGKIVAVGGADGNFLVARYNLDGSLDPSFSGDGREQTNFTGSDGATDVALQGNKIVVVGFSTATAGTARLRPRPLQPGRLARHELLRRRQADDRLRGPATRRTGWRSRANGKIVAVGVSRDH